MTAQESSAVAVSSPVTAGSNCRLVVLPAASVSIVDTRVREGRFLDAIEAALREEFPAEFPVSGDRSCAHVAGGLHWYAGDEPGADELFCSEMCRDGYHAWLDDDPADAGRFW